MENTKLKVKIKSLAAEALIIKAEERKAKAQAGWNRGKQGHEEHAVEWDALRSSLHRHRTHDVRINARAANLAYAFLRGREYKRVEQTWHEYPRIGAIAQNLRNFGNHDSTSREDLTRIITEWISDTTSA